MNLYYNRPSTLSREVDLTVPAWDEGAFFRTTNRILTIASDKTSTRQSKKILANFFYFFFGEIGLIMQKLFTAHG